MTSLKSIPLSSQAGCMASTEALSGATWIAVTSVEIEVA
jgi:hypothetical protein